jgi:hypothetical protein
MAKARRYIKLEYDPNVRQGIFPLDFYDNPEDAEAIKATAKIPGIKSVEITLTPGIFEDVPEELFELGIDDLTLIGGVN